MKQTTRESMAYQAASDWLDKQLNIEVKYQREAFVRNGGGGPDRFNRLRALSAPPKAKDIQAVATSYPEFKDRYNIELERIEASEADPLTAKIIALIERLNKEADNKHDDALEFCRELNNNYKKQIIDLEQKLEQLKI